MPLAAVAALGPSLMAQLLPHAIEREKQAAVDVRQRNESEGAGEAREIIGAVFSSDKEKSVKIAVTFLFFMVYSPEQVEILLKSPKAKALLMSGKLLTAAEISQLKEQQEEPPQEEPPRWREE